jgi:hypothetical protein
MSDKAEGLATSTGNGGPRKLAWYYQIQLDVVKFRKPPQRRNRDENNNDDRLSTYLLRTLQAKGGLRPAAKNNYVAEGTRDVMPQATMIKPRRTDTRCNNSPGARPLKRYCGESEQWVSRQKDNRFRWSLIKQMVSAVAI